MIGAIVGEYFGGSQQQLGIVIKNAAALFNFETAWAAIIVACMLGIDLLPGGRARRAPRHALAPVTGRADMRSVSAIQQRRALDEGA